MRPYRPGERVSLVVRVLPVDSEGDELEAEADRIFASHAEWMQGTLRREGDKALLQYTLTKGSHCEREDAVVYAMTEVYQSPAGPEDHTSRRTRTGRTTRP